MNKYQVAGLVAVAVVAVPPVVGFYDHVLHDYVYGICLEIMRPLIQALMGTRGM